MCTVVVVPAGVVVHVLCALSTILISLVALCVCVCAGMCESEPIMGVAVGRLPPEHYVWPLADMTGTCWYCTTAKVRPAGPG